MSERYREGLGVRPRRRVSDSGGIVTSDVMNKVNDIFKDMFEDDELVLTRETTANDVVGWDSLMHVRLILQI